MVDQSPHSAFPDQWDVDSPPRDERAVVEAGKISVVDNGYHRLQGRPQSACYLSQVEQKVIGSSSLSHEILHAIQRLRSGRRSVPMLAILRGYLEADLERTGRTGADLVFGRTPDAAFVSSTIDNRAKNAWSTFNDHERGAAAAADREPEPLQPITLHECRHTFASLLIDAGANPKAVQTFMGHSKIQTTFDIYGHLLPGSHDEVRQRMDTYLQEPRRSRDTEHRGTPSDKEQGA